MQDEKAERPKQLDRVRGQRYRAKHPDRVKAMARERNANYRKRNPSAVAATEAKAKEKLIAALAADTFSVLQSRAERFWANVEKTDGCWPWTAAKTSQGYGRFNIANGKWMPASRVSLILKLGRNLGEKMFACHTCDNPICCNPDHLYEGTQKQNIDDKSKRGRHVPRSGTKLTSEIAAKIFSAEGTQASIAERFNVNRTMVSMIKSGKRWGRIGTKS